jgi:hypothetical protein
MTHSVDDFYRKAKVLLEKAEQLHRERYKPTGEYDQAACQYMMDDVKSLARDIEHGLFNIDKD